MSSGAKPGARLTSRPATPAVTAAASLLEPAATARSIQLLQVAATHSVCWDMRRLPACAGPAALTRLIICAYNLKAVFCKGTFFLFHGSGDALHVASDRTEDVHAHSLSVYTSRMFVAHLSQGAPRVSGDMVTAVNVCDGHDIGQTRGRREVRLRELVARRSHKQCACGAHGVCIRIIQE